MLICELATGPCTVVADGICTEPKTLANLPPLEDVVITGNNSGYSMSWDTSTSYPNLTVTILSRVTDDLTKPRDVLPRDNGSFYDDSYSTLSIITIMYRTESATEYGEWTIVRVLALGSELDGNYVVYHGDDPVFFGEDVVLFPKSTQYALDPDGNIMLDPDGNPVPEF